MIYVDSSELGLIGDALCAVPAILSLGEEVVLGSHFNKWVFDGIDWDVARLNDGDMVSCQKIKISPSKAFQFSRINGGRMDECHLKLLGLKGAEVKFKIDPVDLQLNLAVPFTRTDINGNKNYQFWAEVLSDRDFTVLCSHLDPYFGKKLTLSMAQTCSVILQSKGIITVTTGLAHLCHFLKFKRHVQILERGLPDFGRTKHGIVVDLMTPPGEVLKQFDIAQKL